MPTADPAEDVLPGSVWTAAAVARRLGVAPSTLRGWSLRYGIGPTGHHAGRHRRYTAADVAELDIVRTLVDQGMAIPAAAAVARGRRFSWPDAEDEEQISAEAVHRLASAARHLDSLAAGELVSTSLTRFGVVPTWNRLCRPALALLDLFTVEIRPGGPAGRPEPDNCVDAELLLSWVIGTRLRALGVTPVAAGSYRVLLACADGDQHTLALEALLAALTERGVDARMLGPSVPTTALVAAAETLRPGAVVVWSQMVDTASPTTLEAVDAATELVVAAGPGWHVDVPTSERAKSLDDAVSLLCGRAGV